MKEKLIKNLMEKLWERYEYASILASDVRGKRYSVSKRGVACAMSGLLSGCGYVIKVHNGHAFAEYSFGELTENNIEEIITEVDRVYEMEELLNREGIELVPYDVPEEIPVKSFSENEMHGNPDECDDSVIVDKLREVRKHALAMDDRILDCQAGAQYQIYTKYFLSKSKELKEKVLWMTGNYFIMAKNGEAVRSYYKAYSNRDGIGVLDKMEDGLAGAVKGAIELLDTKTIKPGEYDCICTPEVTGMIAHEAFGHGVEMDMFYKDRALAVNYIGKQVASELVTMHDGAKAAIEVASYDFDDDGTIGQDTVVIDHGILKKGICDAQSAMALKTAPTGNGRRESYERKAYTRMTNTFFEGGKDSLDDMIASIKYGFLLENATCGMEDPKNWGIQCMVNMAREIVDGKLTGVIYSPIVLSGYVPDLLKSITMMSPVTELCGSGFCGKGYKEWVKVSDGGPYIKARIKLG